MNKHLTYGDFTIIPINNWYGDIKKFGAALILTNSAGESTQQIGFRENFATEREAFEFAAKKGIILIRQFKQGQVELEFL